MNEDMKIKVIIYEEEIGVMEEKEKRSEIGKKEEKKRN